MLLDRCRRPSSSRVLLAAVDEGGLVEDGSAGSRSPSSWSPSAARAEVGLPLSSTREASAEYGLLLRDEENDEERGLCTVVVVEAAPAGDGEAIREEAR